MWFGASFVRVVVFVAWWLLVLLGISPAQPAPHGGGQEAAVHVQSSVLSPEIPLEPAGAMSIERSQTPAPLPKGERAAWIVDDFEDGNIDGWVDEGGGACSASTSAIAAFGSYSMRIDGACGHFLGRYLDVTGSKPTGVSVWLRSNTVDTHDTYFILGDQASGPGGNPGAIYFHGSLAEWSVFDGSVGLSCGPRNPNQWYEIDFVVDWACKMYDVSVDGVPKQSNVPFYSFGTTSFDRIHVYNWSSATARYDQIAFFTPGVSPLIFEDDFERSSTCHWSTVVE